MPWRSWSDAERSPGTPQMKGHLNWRRAGTEHLPALRMAESLVNIHSFPHSLFLGVLRRGAALGNSGRQLYAWN